MGFCHRGDIVRGVSGEIVRKNFSNNDGDVHANEIRKCGVFVSNKCDNV
jgi:hypothetical protein